MRVAVVGASGFVGSAVTRACESGGHELIAVSAPRVFSNAASSDDLEAELAGLHDEVARTADQLAGSDVVVNAAGLADALSGDRAALFGANALVPRLLAAAGDAAGCGRLVHVSSAAVQGRRARLDESESYDPFSPYAESKILGEQAALASQRAVVYRPTSVHGPTRPVTERLAGLARGPISSYAGDGSLPTPQILDSSVGSAVRFLVEQPTVPRIVMHPWEGMTTRSLLEALGAGRRPRHLPSLLARAAVSTLARAATLRPGAQGLARRLEMLWFGQAQAESWLTAAGWTGAATPDDWAELGRRLSAQASAPTASTS